MTPSLLATQPTHVVPELAIDAPAEIARIVSALAQHLVEPIDRHGCVVVLSPTIESALCAALAVRAVGQEHVLGLSLPDRESRPGDDPLVRHTAEALGIELVVEDITPVLDAVGCYSRRDAAIRLLIPRFTDAWRWQLLARQEPTGSERAAFHQLVAESPEGERLVLRVPSSEHHAIVAATAFRYRVRAMLAYYYADLRQSAVIGSLNRRQYEQGEFVKGGDGLSDIEPLAHLYASQIAQLAAAMHVDTTAFPRAVSDVAADFDTEGELRSSIAEETFEMVLNAFNRGVHHSVTAARVGYSASQVARLYRDISRRRRATRYLHIPPLLTPEFAGAAQRAD